MVGSYTDSRGTHNFVRSADGSTYTTIDLAGASPGTTTIGAINNVGQIAGTYIESSTGFIRCYVGSADGSAFTPFDIGPEFGPAGGPHGINDNGVVSGAIVEVSASGSEGFVRTPDGTITPIGISAAGTRVRGIDNNGEIVGWYVAGGSEQGLAHGFVRNPAGVIASLDLPGTDNFTELVAIDNHGQVAGSWGDGTGFVSIADGSYPILAPPGAQFVLPAAIDDTGRVAGYYNDGATNHGFLAVPTAGGTQPVIRSFPPGAISALAFGGASTVAPGTWIEIYGESLASATRPWAASDFAGNTAPTSLDNVAVSIGGIPAYVSYIGPGQVNALVPPEITAGSAQVIVSNGPQFSAPYTVTVNAAQPSLLVLPRTDNQNSRYLAAVFPDFVTYVLPPGYTTAVPTRRAQPGDTIVLLGMGLGPVSPSVPAGQIAPQASMLEATPTVAFNSTPASVTYAGLVEGTVGLYQINVVVPNISMPSGQTFDDSVNVTVQVNGAVLPPGPPPMFWTLPVAQQ
jgi:uncharacterized protein (TIGR03437 family)